MVKVFCFQSTKAMVNSLQHELLNLAYSTGLQPTANQAALRGPPPHL